MSQLLFAYIRGDDLPSPSRFAADLRLDLDDHYATLADTPDYDDYVAEVEDRERRRRRAD
ncbi:hypothetical protein ACOKM3_07520 [Streptomyces sp. BH106]|uniref:hypothetical protein n=1 Tax=Streptomyces sp. BH106 TaxID=3410409 RepID=UPI003CECB93D